MYEHAVKHLGLRASIYLPIRLSIFIYISHIYIHVQIFMYTHSLGFRVQGLC